jgi:hypothetical protein
MRGLVGGVGLEEEDIAPGVLFHRAPHVPFACFIIMVSPLMVVL